jgi:hypothetical protein
LAANG